MLEISGLAPDQLLITMKSPPNSSGGPSDTTSAEQQLALPLASSSARASSIMTPTPDSSVYMDPNKALPEGLEQRRAARIRKLKRLFALFLLRQDDEPQTPVRSAAITMSTIRLTERNLTELFNPDYCDDLDIFTERIHPNTVKPHVRQWVEALP
jgi:hypothetical protein